MDVHDLQGCILDVVLLPLSSKVVAGAAQQSKLYSELTQAEKAGRGPPHVYAFLGMTTGLLGEPTLPPPHAAELSQWMEQMGAMTAQKLAEVLRMCCAAKCYKPGQRNAMCRGRGSERRSCRP